MSRRFVATVSGVLLSALLAGAASGQVVRPRVPRPHAEPAAIPPDDPMGIPELGLLPPPKVHFEVLTSGLNFGSLWPGDTPSAVLQATAEGCDAFRLGLHLPPGHEKFVLTQKRFDGTEVCIPSTWRLRWDTGCGWTEWLEPNTGAMPAKQEPMLWWEVGEPGRCAYQLELRCELNMAPIQLAGNYNATIRFTAVPVPQSAPEPGAAAEADRGEALTRTSAGADRAQQTKPTHSREVKRVPRGPTARWYKRWSDGVREWTRRPHKP